MAVENALGFLRSLGSDRALTPATIIFGPHAFLREYVLGTIARRLAAAGFQYRSFQVGAGDDFGAVLDELTGADLFAPKRLVVCRVLKSRRDRSDDADDSGGDGAPSRAGAVAGESALAAAIEENRGPAHLAVVYERDNAPAKIRRAAEKSATLVNCLRPFDSQLDQYLQAIARGEGLRLAPATIDLLISRHAGDLAAIANAIGKAAIFAEAGKPVGAEQVDEPGGRRMPGVFEISESLARGRPAEALAQIDRAVGLGRDPIEILAVEIIPLLRRMAVAAALLARRKPPGEVAAAMGMSPSSPLAARAIEGARRLGAQRIERALARAALLDAGFKNGQVKERAEAISALLLELLGTARATSSRASAARR
jgi:DNA polymerase III delta subunit